MQIYTPPANLPLPKPFVTDDNLATHWTRGRKRWQDTHRSLHLHEREHQSCSASPSRHGRQGRQVSLTRPEISPALELRFKTYPQYGRNTNAVWAAGHQNLGVYREQNSPSVVMRRRQAKFHGWSDSESEQLPPKVTFKGVRQLNINTPPRMQISVHKKGWMDKEGMFYLHAVYSENELFEQATNMILGIQNCIVVMDIMLLGTCC